jgi:hypothetical protein
MIVVSYLDRILTELRQLLELGTVTIVMRHKEEQMAQAIAALQAAEQDIRQQPRLLRRSIFRGLNPRSLRRSN